MNQIVEFQRREGVTTQCTMYSMDIDDYVGF